MESNIFSIRFKKAFLKKKASKEIKSQEHLSQKSGVNINTIKKYMKASNKELPTLGTAELLAKTLDVDVAYLLGEIDYPHWKDIKVNEVTALSPNAINVLATYKKDRDSALEFEDSYLENIIRNNNFDINLIEIIEKNTEEQNNSLLSHYDNVFRSHCNYYIKQKHNPYPFNNILSQIISHQDFYKLMESIDNAQERINQISRLSVKQGCLQNDEKQSFIDKHIYDLNKYYIAELFNISNIFNAIVKDICESDSQSITD